MLLALLQINDIHIRNGDNPAISLVDKIVSAMRGLYPELAGCIVVVPGDIAYSGSSDEYRLAEGFFRELLARIQQEFPGIVPQIVLSPGNHDCNLQLATDIRQRSLLGSLLHTLEVTGAMATQWLTVQEPYFAFTERLGHVSDGNGQKMSLRREFVIAKSQRVAFTTYNTAWLSQNPETPGELHMPINWFENSIDVPADIEVSVFHHPYNWLEPTNARAFKELIESRSDLVLTGHEHKADAYTKLSNENGAVTFVEGQAMYDPREPENGFNVILIDMDARRWQLSEFILTKDYFNPRSEAHWTPFLRNKQLADQGFENSPKFANDLRDVGTGFTHPKKVELHLRDLFVYPTLVQRELQRKVEGKKALATRVEGRDLIQYVLLEKKIVILGSDLSGKTALAKTLYTDLQQSGKIPILINGTDLKSGADFPTIIARAFERQYSASSLERYRQLEPAQKVVIIDDCHRATMSRAAHVLEDADRIFGNIIVLADDRFEIDAIVTKGGQRVFIKYRQLHIQEFGRPARARLIENWLTLGRVDLEGEDLYREIAVREKTIDTLLGRQLLPAFPIIVLGILQTLEATRNLNSSSGSYGELYEAFITDRLATVSQKAADLGTKYTLLSRVAYWMYEREVDSLTRDDMRAVCEDYFKEYRMHVDSATLVENLLFAQILHDADSNLHFKYRYYYHFFVARYLRDNSSDAAAGPKVNELLTHMADRVYFEDYSQILVFYLYLTKDVGVIRQIVHNAERIYGGVTVADLENDVNIINALYTSSPKPIELPSADVQENRDALRKQLDEADAVRVARDGEKVCYHDELDNFIKINFALKTLFILGQVLRNFPGSLKRDIKFRIAEQCYLLGLRVLSVVLASIADNVEQFTIYFTEMIRATRPALTPMERAQSAEEAVISLAELWTFGLLKTISQALGTEDLAETYREVVDAHGKLLSVQLVDLAIKLDHYGSFPENQVDVLERRVHRNLLGYCVLRHMIAHYFYIFRSTSAVRQKYCDRFEIGTRQTLLLGSGLRKT